MPRNRYVHSQDHSLKKIKIAQEAAKLRKLEREAPGRSARHAKLDPVFVAVNAEIRDIQYYKSLIETFKSRDYWAERLHEESGSHTYAQLKENGPEAFLKHLT